MDRVQHIAVITGGRADFGLLSNLCQILDEERQINLTVVATGSHLSKAHGYTLNEVISYDFRNLETIDLNIQNDTAKDINLYISRAVSKFSYFFSKHKIHLFMGFCQCSKYISK